MRALRFLSRSASRLAGARPPPLLLEAAEQGLTAAGLGAGWEVMGSAERDAFVREVEALRATLGELARAMR